MSYHSYLVCPKNKILVDIGSQNAEDYKEDIKKFASFVDKIDTLKDQMLEETKYKDLTLDNLKDLLELYDKCLWFQNAYWFPLVVGMFAQDNPKMQIIGENELDNMKYKGWTVIDGGSFE